MGQGLESKKRYFTFFDIYVLLTTMAADLVLFEGLDLSGKTSAAYGFADKAPGTWQVRDKVLHEINPYRVSKHQLNNDERLSDITVGWLHYAYFRTDLDLYEDPVTPTVQESLSALRSVAFHTVLGDKKLAEAFRRHLDELDIFSSAFLLTASIETRKERLAKRKQTNPGAVSFMDLLVEQEPSCFQEMEEVLIQATREVSPSLTIIDTDSLSIKGVVDLAINKHFNPTLFDSTKNSQMSTSTSTGEFIETFVEPTAICA